MDKFSPQQDLHTTLMILCNKLAPTYDYLPPEGTPYPFIFVGEDFSIDRATKSVIIGNFTKKIHVYEERTKRGDLYKLINDIKYNVRLLNHSKHFYMSVYKMQDRVLIDNTTAQTLLHGIIDIDLNFN